MMRNKMTEEQIIDVESVEVAEERMPAEMYSEPPIKTKEQRALEQERFNQIKKMIKEKKRYYKSNLFAIKRLDAQ
jgi:hypothetical protein